VTVNVFKFYDNTQSVPVEVISELERYRKFRVLNAIRKFLWGKVTVTGDTMKMLLTFTLSLTAVILLVYLHGNILASCFIFFSLCIYLSLFIGAVMETVSRILIIT